MLKTIILEDERNNLAFLQGLLADHCPQVSVTGIATSVAEGLQRVREQSFDLALVDVKLKDGNAFDWLTRLPNTNFHLIFITAYDHYALQAIRYSAIDYLLKPVEPMDLLRAVEKVEEREQQREADTRLKELLRNLEAPPEEKRLAVPQRDRIEFILIQNIIRCQGDGNYTHIILPDRKIVVAKTLREYEELLQGEGFIRIHQSHLVQISYIGAYYRQGGGYITLLDGTRLSVSRHRREQVLEQLRNR